MAGLVKRQSSPYLELYPSHRHGYFSLSLSLFFFFCLLNNISMTTLKIHKNDPLHLIC